MITPPAKPTPTDQMLFDWSQPRRSYKQRFRQFDLPVLRTVAAAGLIPSWTLIARLWNYEGIHPGHAWRVLSRLSKAGFMHQHKLRPADGQRSPRILELTTVGYEEAGVEPPRVSHWLRPEAVRWYLAARAETLTVRAAEGWRLATGPAAFEALRASSLARRRTEAQNWMTLQEFERVERAPVRPLPTHVLWHAADQASRLLLPVARGRNIRRLLRALPDIRLFGPLTFELVNGEPDRVADARTVLEDWAARTGYRIETTTVRPFVRREHPATDFVSEGSLRAAHGVPEALSGRGVADLVAAWEPVHLSGSHAAPERRLRKRKSLTARKKGIVGRQ